MKTKATLIIGTACIAVFGCESKTYTEQDRVAVTTEMNSFVDSVESAVNATPVHDWSKMNTRFDSLESRAGKIYSDLEVEETEVEILEERYETAIENGKRSEENFKTTADMHMENLETWWESTTKDGNNTAATAAGELEQSTKESLEWLEANFEKLGDETKEKYNKFLDEMRKS